MSGKVTRLTLTLNSMTDLFCVCRGYEDGCFMICCDPCDEWYHGECIGIDETERKKYVETDILFICSFCQAT